MMIRNELLSQIKLMNLHALLFAYRKLRENILTVPALKKLS